MAPATPTSPQAPAPSSVAISNVLVILPSITRGFQPKNYHPPAYAHIGRSPSLPFTTDGLTGMDKGHDRLTNPRSSIAYGHAASQEYRGAPRSAAGGDTPQEIEGSETPYAMSSGRLSPAARKEITAQLSVPITPNSLPSDARRQSIGTLLPAGIMSSKLSQLILEEEEANRREQAGESTPSPGRPETIPERTVETQPAIPKTQRPFPLPRSTSGSPSANTSPVLPDIVPAHKPRRGIRSRPQTSAAAFSGPTTPPGFGSRSARPLAMTTLQDEPARVDQKRSRAAGSGKPGWEGEEMVSILREDGIQGRSLYESTGNVSNQRC